MKKVVEGSDFALPVQVVRPPLRRCTSSHVHSVKPLHDAAGCGGARRCMHGSGAPPSATSHTSVGSPYYPLPTRVVFACCGERDGGAQTTCLPPARSLQLCRALKCAVTDVSINMNAFLDADAQRVVQWCRRRRATEAKVRRPFTPQRISNAQVMTLAW